MLTKKKQWLKNNVKLVKNISIKLDKKILLLVNLITVKTKSFLVSDKSFFILFQNNSLIFSSTWQFD